MRGFGNKIKIKWYQSLYPSYSFFALFSDPLGDSAGGNLAATISIKLRDEKFPIQPKLQVLLYPALQLVDLNTPSYQANADGPAITKELVAWFITNYLQVYIITIPIIFVLCQS